MNRNVESHFSQVPYIDKPRSIFDRSYRHLTSFNVGQLIPFFCDPVLPGDTFRVTTSKVVRMQTLLTPIMDNVYLDVYYFFVPWRLLWDHVREFFGENTSSPWVQTTTYRLPAISAPSGTGFTTGSLADYFGLPVGVTWSNQDRNAPTSLPFRAYAKIVDEFFRDQNVSYPLNIPTGDSDQTGTNGSSYVNDVANGGAPFVVCKFHDEFTSCLPSPLKAANPVSIPLFNNSTMAPVVPIWQKWTDDYGADALSTRPAAYPPMTGSYTYDYVGSTGLSSVVSVDTDAQGNNYLHYIDQGSVLTETGTLGLQSELMTVNNLWAKLASANVNVTVNELRLSFQMQRYYEQLARGGSRYIEYMRNFYGVTSPDARLQRPEYLGGNRVPLTITQVLNSAQTNTDFLGDVGAMSHTSDIHDDFEKSFTEFGYVIGVMCCRYDHTYAQGMERFWTRRDLFDQYVPTLAHIGEQPKYTYELYADGYMDSDDVFGYQEAWSDYRYKKSYVSSEMRPGVANTLASWHLADYYQSAPTLSDSWMREDKSMVDRVLAVGSNVSNQLFADIYVSNKVTRVMPMYSVPGLIDHF